MIWKTNIPSESKVILEGKNYFSERGVGTIHSVKINDLESGFYYKGNITAIVNDAWKNQDFDFTTELPALKITVTSQNCLVGSRCKISWQTNYKSDGRVTIYKKDSDEILYSLNSSPKNIKEHSVEFNLEPNTEYTFKIYATSDKDYSKTTGGFKTPQASTTTPKSCFTSGIGGRVCAAQA